MSLSVDGKATLDECFECWEDIIQKSSDATGDGGYKSYFQNLRNYARLVRDFNLIKINITILYFEIDKDCIAYLASKGYVINTSTASGYLESLNNAMTRSNNIVSRMVSAYKLLEKATAKPKGSNKRPSFEQAMAHLTVALEMQVSDDITLARYNEYQKIIDKKNAANKNNKHGGRIRKK